MDHHHPNNNTEEVELRLKMWSVDIRELQRVLESTSTI